MFTHTRLSKLAATVIGGAAIGLAALASAGNATASSTDDAFLAAATDQGIEFSSAQEAAGDAHKVCQLLAAGNTGVEVGSDILQETDLTSHQAAFLVVASVKAYCPQYAGNLTA
jgi:hypothetical protein